jgi:hypothetical protein
MSKGVKKVFIGIYFRELKNAQNYGECRKRLIKGYDYKILDCPDSRAKNKVGHLVVSQKQFELMGYR